MMCVKDFITTPPLRQRQSENMTRPPVPKPPASITYSPDSNASRHDRQDGGGLGSRSLKTLFPNAELNLLSPGSGCPLQAGTGHGRPGRAPGRCVVTSLLHGVVEGPVADDRMSSFPLDCCCCRGTCRVGLRLLVRRQRGRVPDGARSLPCVVAQRSCAGSGPLPRALLVGACNRGPPSLVSASMSGLSCPVLPRRL